MIQKQVTTVAPVITPTRTSPRPLITPSPNENPFSPDKICPKQADKIGGGD